MSDPNPRVSGRGITQLRRAGIVVQTGVLQTECERINEFFSKYIATRMPFVAIKISQTVDGRIAFRTDEKVGITGTASRKFVHALRSRYDAVLVGAGTVRSDDPLLTVRDVAGRNPLRVVVDGNLSTRTQSRIYRTVHAPTILYTSSASARRHPSKIASYRKRGVLVIPLGADRNRYIPMKHILANLASLGIASVLVEGGAMLFRSCLSEKVADKIFLLIAPKVFGRGLMAFEDAPLDRLRNISVSELDGDVLIEGYLH
jgi:diaminohydroxyphosphoribosylaminopyrimidine deaminase/5-amino-6-(5-phosphoribosylamino)uracil reductase